MVIFPNELRHSRLRVNAHGVGGLSVSNVNNTHRVVFRRALPCRTLCYGHYCRHPDCLIDACSTRWLNLGKVSEHELQFTPFRAPHTIYLSIYHSDGSDVLRDFQRRGVFIPTERDVYSPLLQRLASHGILFVEKDETIKRR